jgi:hypothetical protein
MAQTSIEKRLETLEAQMSLLLAQGSGTKDWRKAVQRYAGDEDLQQIFQTALKLREADRNKARRTSRRRKAQ